MSVSICLARAIIIICYQPKKKKSQKKRHPILSWIHSQMQSSFSSLSHMRIYVFEVMSIYPIDRYQNAIPRVMPLNELLQEHIMLMTHDSIGHLKMLCMSILSLSGGIEFEWKHCSSLLSVEKTQRSSMNPALWRLKCINT